MSAPPQAVPARVSGWHRFTAGMGAEIALRLVLWTEDLVKERVEV
jgi:hypothetical protein